jgi:hypothetical protein
MNKTIPVARFKLTVAGFNLLDGKSPLPVAKWFRAVDFTLPNRMNSDFFLYNAKPRQSHLFNSP